MSFQEEHYSRPPRVDLMILVKSTTSVKRGSDLELKGVYFSVLPTPPHGYTLTTYYPLDTFRTIYQLSTWLGDV